MNKLEIFNQYKPLLFSIAYNMLGSAMDAEDMVQEAYLRWEGAAEVETPKAYLSSIVTNLCINHLQSARMQRETYLGPWLPEPIVTEPAADPQNAAALAETLSMAFLVLLENCSPPERAAFLLRQVFDYEYSEIAAMLGKSEAACRQLVSRARQRITAHRHLSLQPTTSEHQQVLGQFMQALLQGDLPVLMNLIADDCVMQSDGGGKASAAIHPVIGAEKIGRFLMGILKKAPKNTVSRVMLINGLPGIVSYVGRDPVLVMTLDVVDGRIQNIYNVRNPDKLKQIPVRKDGEA